MTGNQNIKILFLDVDGTLTDGKIYMGQNGEMFKAFNIKDGCALKDILPKHGVVPVVITARNSAIVENRCQELGITELYQGVSDKLAKMRDVLFKYDLELNNATYMGDDLNDSPCMNTVRTGGGIAACPADATEEVRAVCDFVCTKNGGNGAVREFADWLVKNKKC